MVCSSVISDFPLRPLGLCCRLKGFKNAHRRRHRPGTGTISSRRPARLPSPAEPARQGREHRAGNELIGPVALLRVSAHGRPFPPAAATCSGGGGVPPALASPWPTAAAPAAGRRETWPCDPGKRTCVPTAGAALPRLDTACVTAARLPSATFWEGKSVGTLGPAPGDGRPVYAHVYFTGSDVAAQNLERVVTLRHGSELFNPQSGSRSRAGRPGDWVGGGLASPLLPLSAATSQTPTSLPSNRDAGSLPFRFRHLGVGAGHNVPPAFPFRDADPAGGGGRWGVCAGCLRFGSRAGETFPHPPAPAPEGSVSP